jgi:hypothetical protein
MRSVEIGATDTLSYFATAIPSMFCSSYKYLLVKRMEQNWLLKLVRNEEIAD